MPDERLPFKYTYNIRRVFHNLDKICKEHQEKEKKKEIGKIINSLQTPMNHLIEILNHHE